MSGKVYQLEEVAKELKEMRKDQSQQSAILQQMSEVLTGIGQALQDFKNFSTKQIRHEMKIEELAADMKCVKGFLNEKQCAVHSQAIETIQKSDDGQNDKSFLIFIALMTIAGSILTGWLFNKG